jgi:hypothetical protein
MSDAPQIGAWQRLTGGGGATLAVAGKYTAAAQLGSLTVWRDGDVLVTVDAPSAAPGRPRFIPDLGEPDRVHWGPTIVDLTVPEWDQLDGLLETVAPNVPRRPGRAGASVPRPTSYDWSPDGSAVLVARQETGAPQSLTASASLYDKDGTSAVPLWQGNDPGPVAGFVGRRWAVVGTRQPAVFDLGGRQLAVLDGRTPATRIEADARWARVLVVESSRLWMWDTGTWEAIGTADGRWLDATVTPDARFVLAVDFDGQLQMLDAALDAIGHVAVPRALDGVAVGTDRIVVAASGAVFAAPMSA